jgi:hypothetical protein
MSELLAQHPPQCANRTWLFMMRLMGSLHQQWADRQEVPQPASGSEVHDRAHELGAQCLYRTTCYLQAGQTCPIGGDLAAWYDEQKLPFPPPPSGLQEWTLVFPEDGARSS